MSEIETLKFIADAGVGLVSLFVLAIVLRVGDRVIRNNEQRTHSAEARETAAHARAERAIAESEQARGALVEARALIDDLKHKHESALTTIGELRAQLDQMTKRLDAAEGKLEAAAQKGADDAIALDSARRELKAAMARVTELMEKLAAEENTTRALRMENQTLAQDKQRLAEEKKQLEERLTASEARVETLEAQVHQLQTQVEDLIRRKTGELTRADVGAVLVPEGAG